MTTQTRDALARENAELRARVGRQEALSRIRTAFLSGLGTGTTLAGVRVTDQILAIVDEAVRVAGAKDRSAFVRDAVQAACERVLGDHAAARAGARK